MNQITKARRLKAGNKIGIVALSGPIHTCKESFIERGYARLKDLGFELVEAPNLRTLTGHCAGSIRERAESLMNFYKDPDIKGIMSFWGGMQTHQTLEYLDFEIIKKNPKVLIGYSDTSSLLTAVYSQTGQICFNGPAVISFAKPDLPELTLNSFKANNASRLA